MVFLEIDGVLLNLAQVVTFECDGTGKRCLASVAVRGTDDPADTLLVSLPLPVPLDAIRKTLSRSISNTRVLVVGSDGKEVT